MTVQREDGRLAAVACLMTAMVGFGTIPIFLKHFTDVLDPWTVNGIRYSVGAIFWLPFVLLLQRRPEPGTGNSLASAADAEAALEESVSVPGDNPGEPPPGTSTARSAAAAAASGPNGLSIWAARAARGLDETSSACGTPIAELSGPPPRNVWRDALVPSVVNILGQVGFGVCPYYVLASTLGFVTRLSFLFTIVFGFAFLAEERLLARRPVFWVGAAVSMVGVMLMFLEKLQEGGRESLFGLTILVATAVAWGAYSVSVRRYMACYPVRQSFGVISLYTSAALVLLMLVFGRVDSLKEIDAFLWANLMGSAMVGIAFGHVLYYRGIHRLGPVVASGVMLATPFVTYLGAALLLEERLSAIELFGGLLVVAGGALLVLSRAQVERG